MCHIKCFSCHLPPVICHLLFAICQLATLASMQTQQKKTFKKLDGVGPVDTWQVTHDSWHIVIHDMWHVTSRLLDRYGLRPMQWKLYGEGTTTYIQHMDMATARLTWLQGIGGGGGVLGAIYIYRTARQQVWQSYLHRSNSFMNQKGFPRSDLMTTEHW